MSLNEYTLDGEFDVLATWFRVGERYKDGVKGKLHYSSGLMVLDLYDSLSDSSLGESKEIERLYGISTKGEYLILNQCFRVSEDASFHGFAVESYSIDTFYILESEHEIPMEAAISKIKRVRFSLNYLYSWINTSSFELGLSEPQQYLVPSQGIIMSVGVSHRRKRKTRAIILEENYFIELIDKNHKIKNFDSFLRDTLLVKKLIEFLNNTPLQYDYIELTLPRGKGRYFFKQVERKLTHLPQNTLTLDQIDNEFASMLDLWFLKADKFDLMIDNYLNDLYLDYYIETKLVNSIRNLEVYYRNFVRAPYYIEDRKEALKADQQLLLDFVEREVSEENKKHFIVNILYIGEESLRVKLNDLVKNLPEQLFNICIKQTDKSPSKSRNAFINKLIETRNFYTHGDEAENYPNRLTDPQDYRLINEKLKIIQQYYIYKELGLTEDLILSILLPKAYNLG